MATRAPKHPTLCWLSGVVEDALRRGCHRLACEAPASNGALGRATRTAHLRHNRVIVIYKDREKVQDTRRSSNQSSEGSARMCDDVPPPEARYRKEDRPNASFLRSASFVLSNNYNQNDEMTSTAVAALTWVAQASPTWAMLTCPGSVSPPLERTRYLLIGRVVQETFRWE